MKLTHCKWQEIKQSIQAQTQGCSWRAKPVYIQNIFTLQPQGCYKSWPGKYMYIEINCIENDEFLFNFSVFIWGENEDEWWLVAYTKLWFEDVLTECFDKHGLRLKLKKLRKEIDSIVFF
jgi:hypothetical protein